MEADPCLGSVNHCFGVDDNGDVINLIITWLILNEYVPAYSRLTQHLQQYLDSSLMCSGRHAGWSANQARKQSHHQGDKHDEGILQDLMPCGHRCGEADGSSTRSWTAVRERHRVTLPPCVSFLMA